MGADVLRLVAPIVEAQMQSHAEQRGAEVSGRVERVPPGRVESVQRVGRGLKTEREDQRAVHVDGAYRRC